MKLTITNIGADSARITDQITEFIQSLDEEKRFFSFTPERYLKTEMRLIAELDGEVIGFAGLERKHGFARSLIIVNRKAHGTGTGRELFQALLRHASERYHVILGVVEAGNKKGQQIQASNGYKYVGRLEGLSYSFRPFTVWGNIIVFSMHLVLPFIRIVNWFRN